MYFVSLSLTKREGDRDIKRNMSYTPNQIWLENAKENFDEALEKRDFAQAQAVIDDVAENGFTKEAEVLFKQWNEDTAPFFIEKKAHDALWKSILGHD